MQNGVFPWTLSDCSYVKKERFTREDYLFNQCIWSMSMPLNTLKNLFNMLMRESFVLAMNF